jgi:FixJ family two-component response regulator
MPRAHESADTRPLILLVEDDAALGPALKFALQVDGYAVELMDTAEALVERAFPSRPFCIITDLFLPGLLGIDTLEILRRRGVTAPAILMTTQPSPSVLKRAGAVGAVLLEKPILEGHLEAALAALAADSGILRT